MTYVVALVAAYVPVLLWVWFFYGQDRYHPIPQRLVVTLFLLGLGATAPTGWINQYFVSFGDSASGTVRAGLGAVAVAVGIWIVVYAVAAVLEEATKFAFGLARLVGEPAIVEVVDGVIALTVVGLGFAAAENTKYVFDQLTLAVPTRFDLPSVLSALLTVAPQRGVVSTLGHVAWSGIVGYAVGAVLVHGRSRIRIVVALAAAVALHAGFNTLASPEIGALGGLGGLDPTLSRIGALSVWGVALAIYVVLFRHALEDSPYRMMQLKSRLLGVPSLAGVARERLAVAASQLAPEIVRAGDRIAVQGAPADRFIVVVEGRFRVSQTPGPGATPREQPPLLAGDVFGHVALLTERVTTRDVAAETDGMILTLDRAAFLDFVGDDEELRQRLLDLGRGATASQVMGGALRQYSRAVHLVRAAETPSGD